MVVEVTKVTYETALARIKHSVDIRKRAMQQAEKRWLNKGVKGKVLFL